MAELTTRSGDVFLVDDADVELVSPYTWYSARTKNGVYVMRRSPTNASGKRPTVLLHRWLLDASPGMQVDHKNHDTLDNRRENLRQATARQNQANQKIRSGGSSAFKGVSWDSRGQVWRAYLGQDGRVRYLGTFRVEDDAARAYDAAVLKVHGEFAFLNFPLVA